VGAAKDFRGLAVAGVGRQLGSYPHPLCLHDPGDPKLAVLRVFRLPRQSLHRVRFEGLPPVHRRIRHAHGCLCGALDHSRQHPTAPLGLPGVRPHRRRRVGPYGACTALNPFTDIAYVGDLDWTTFLLLEEEPLYGLAVALIEEAAGQQDEAQ
jgi:hypothetical protein